LEKKKASVPYMPDTYSLAKTFFSAPKTVRIPIVADMKLEIVKKKREPVLFCMPVWSLDTFR